MSNKLKIMCATLVITLMPMGSICYAKTNQVTTEEYKTIWVEPDKKEENKAEQKTMNSEEELKEISLADILELSKDQERCKKVKGKEVCMKIVVNKVDKNDDCYYIITKDGMLKKGEFKISKEESSKLGNIKKGDEVVLQGTVSDLSNKKVMLENTKILNIKEKTKDIKTKDKKEDIKKNENKKDNHHKKDDHHKKGDHHEKDSHHKKDEHKENKKDCDMKNKEDKKENNNCDDIKEIKPQKQDKNDCNDKDRTEDNKIEEKQ